MLAAWQQMQQLQQLQMLQAMQMQALAGGGMPGMAGMPGTGGFPGMPGAGGFPGMGMGMPGLGLPGFGAIGLAGVDPAALPFARPEPQPDKDPGLDADIIRPALIADLIKVQEAVPTGSVLDLLCLDADRAGALGGLPKGCTIALAGPPGKGKTRSALAALARVARSGVKVALIVAEEGFHDRAGSGRDDLGSRLTKIGMAATGIADLDAFREEVLERVYVLESQYHKGQTWDDFVTKYRYLIESQGIAFVVIDSLNMLDPTKNRTADNLSALKTYNHEKGVTCLCIGQIRDTGQPVGGEALQHTADCVFLIEEMNLRSKEMAAQWGGSYNERIDVIRAVKCVTTPTFPHPVRIALEEGTGEMQPHPAQPPEYAPPRRAG
jgi:KaiC/GvpD/RAD55 family RecA-like ATPase